MIALIEDGGQGLPRIAAAQVLPYVLISVLALTALAALHYTAESEAERRALHTSERLNVALGKTTIMTALAGVESDLAFLAQTAQARGLFHPAARGTRAALGETFLAFVKQKRRYDQVRYIGLDGREHVRVNYNAGEPRLVAEGELQNKAGRYYFDAARTLEPGAVYVSPFDLNVERGRLERPVKPVIRFATPVRDTTGARSGVLVLNYLGARLLGSFRTATANISEHAMLLNADGYWLVSPRGAEEWGFMHDRGTTFQARYPDAWEHIRGGDAGQFETAREMVTFDTVYPRPAAAATAQATGGVPALLRPWKVVSVTPHASLASAPAAFARRYLPLYLVMLVLIAGATALLARSSIRHRMAEGRLAFERRFREVLEDISLNVVALDRNGNITFCNDTLLKLVAWRRDDLLGRNWVDTLVAPESRTACQAMLQTALANGGAASRHECVILTRDGGRRLIAWHDGPVPGRDGALVGITLMGQDITESRETEERNLLLSRAVEQSPASVMITETSGAIEYVNPKFTELTGYSLDEIRGMNPRVLKSGLVSSGEYANLWNTITQGGQWRGLLRNRKRNGELYWESAVISGVRNRDGEIAHFIAVKEDITEHRRLENRFRHCVESAPYAMILAGGDGAMVLVNRMAEVMFGHTREELLGKPIELLVPRGQRLAHTRHRKHFHAAGRSHAMGTGRELLGRRKDGRVFPVDVGLHPIESDEGPLVLASVIDISEHKRLEAALQERDRKIVENNALAAVGRMANMVAHDIRNPLSSVKMGLQILAKKRGRLDREARELNGIALEQVRYMEEVLEDLMSYSRENPLAPEWLQLDKLLDAAVLLVQRHVDERKIKVTTRYQARLPTVHGDPNRLRRAFTNLILNGIQATQGINERAPELVISTQLELAPDRPKIRVEIRDNGCGIASNQRDKVFEPFYTTRASGTGLGLAIVKRIMDQHQGTVEMTSAAIGGACVSIILPTGPLEIRPATGTEATELPAAAPQTTAAAGVSGDAAAAGD